MVPRTRIELVRSYASRDFKSLASTNSATQALFRAILYRILNSCQHHSEDPQENVKVGDKPLVLGVSGDLKIRNPNIETRNNV